jgi:GMP synthase (glutamine-hydrolysing)
MTDTIIVLDFGSQYAHLISRRIRELQIYCELMPWFTPEDEVLSLEPKGFILSGGPLSIYDQDAPVLPKYVLESRLPVLGICYGMQALTTSLGGIVIPASRREFGQTEINTIAENPLITEPSQHAWMSHGDIIARQPEGWQVLATSDNSPVAAMGDLTYQRYGIQFHPEVSHTPNGSAILRRFVIDICGCKPSWTPLSIIETAIVKIRQQVGNAAVLVGLSGGIDSTVAATLTERAIGDQLHAIFVDNGLLRQGERKQVEAVFQPRLGDRLTVVDASKTFLQNLHGVIDPEQKRLIIGETFIRIFEKVAQESGNPKFLVQGTIYPDVVESRGKGADQGQTIKTHHNVGGLPSQMNLELIEPLRYLYKDEVRAVGKALGLEDEMVYRQPFPGPGLAVRCIGEVTESRLAMLRQADAIFTQELAQAGLLTWAPSADGKRTGSSQAFAVLLPTQSVGVMGDQRSYQQVIVLRAVTTDDFMTADWARLPEDLLARVSNRIVNEVHGINRVVYDITAKPPATIEWE